MRLVVVESPFAGKIDSNLTYARAAVRDCLIRGESPIASHLLLTQPKVLDDSIKEERALGIKAGNAWIRVCDALVVYTDLGVSSGMLEGIRCAELEGIKIEYRSIK